MTDFEGTAIQAPSVNKAVKFVVSKMATKIDKIFTVNLTLTT